MRTLVGLIVAAAAGAAAQDPADGCGLPRAARRAGRGGALGVPARGGRARGRRRGGRARVDVGAGAAALSGARGRGMRVPPARLLTREWVARRWMAYAVGSVPSGTQRITRLDMTWTVRAARRVRARVPRASRSDVRPA